MRQIMPSHALATNAALDSAVQKLQLAMRDQAITIITWMTGILIAQGALVVALLQSLQ